MPSSSPNLGGCFGCCGGLEAGLRKPVRPSVSRCLRVLTLQPLGALSGSQAWIQLPWRAWVEASRRGDTYRSRQYQGMKRKSTIKPRQSSTYLQSVPASHPSSRRPLGPGLVRLAGPGSHFSSGHDVHPSALEVGGRFPCLCSVHRVGPRG